jgi:PhnB protein
MDMATTANATKTTAATTAPLPAVRGGVAPYLMVDGAAKAAEFYRRAFGAEVAHSHPADDKGRTMHIHLYINGGSVMLSDFYPEHGYPQQAPQAFNLGLPVDDVDAWWKRAVDAGAKVVMPLEKQFWGDRYGQVRDPFGVTWALFAPAG